MKDPSRSSTSPSIINEDVIINGHSHDDDNPFAEYMWMENEEEFNRQIEEELWEEEFIERCFQEMLEEEEEHEWFIPARDLPQTMDQIQDQFNDLVISDGSSLEDLVVKSNLNPNAKEFVPGFLRTTLLARFAERTDFTRSLCVKYVTIICSAYRSA
uniref:Polyadenylate-binding protein-interacting protein 2 n=1 Tax=Molossus molossus TaxID=27622 RepID=A0A7J8I9W0_MOLMO|nr:poly(A) binding protein interacting protein 2 [Molossus molossus]